MTKYTSQEHEKLLIQRMISSSKKERIKSLLNSKKGRVKLQKSLAHNIEFDPRYLIKIPSGEQTTNLIFELLKREGAPNKCYVISENNKINGNILNLEDTLNIVIGSGMGTIISCIPGKLIYYEGEELKNRFLVKRNE